MPDWSRRFFDPIPLPDGRKLITLHDAATFITKLPKREHDAPERQTAIEALMLVVDLGPDDVRSYRRCACAQPSSRAARETSQEARQSVQDRQMKTVWIVTL